MSYEEQERTEEDFFNVKFLGTRLERGQWLHELVSTPEFRRYEEVKVMLSGNFLMHELTSCELLAELAKESTDLWLRVHNKAYAMARRSTIPDAL